MNTTLSEHITRCNTDTKDVFTFKRLFTNNYISDTYDEQMFKKQTSFKVLYPFEHKNLALVSFLFSEKQ